MRKESDWSGPSRNGVNVTPYVVIRCLGGQNGLKKAMKKAMSRINAKVIF